MTEIIWCTQCGRMNNPSHLEVINADLLAALDNGLFATQQVLNRWDNGDLAGAVNGLEAWQETARAAIAKAKEG